MNRNERGDSFPSSLRKYKVEKTNPIATIEKIAAS
jgi:hypothetical protein